MHTIAIINVPDPLLGLDWHWICRHCSQMGHHTTLDAASTDGSLHAWSHVEWAPYDGDLGEEQEEIECEPLDVPIEEPVPA